MTPALTAYQYNAANEQIVITPPTGAPTTQPFDAVGNLTLQNTSGALTTQTWSPENQMLSIANPDGTSEQNTYSADGLRKSKTSAGTTTVFTWDNQNLLLETNTSNVVQARYTDFPGYWGGLASQNRSGVSSFYLYDSQGSVRNLASTLGAITDTYIYTAFGVELLTSGTTINPFRYVGLLGYYLEFVSLYYIRERWLDAVKGRWDSRDPIGDNGGDWNPYGYVINKAVNLVDPSGLQKTSPGGSVANKPNCEPVVYSCYRPLIFGINHWFLWVHYPCNPKDKDQMIGYGPGGYRKPGQLGEDIDCIVFGNCECVRTNCKPDCVLNAKQLISKGNDPQERNTWDPKSFSLIWHNCQDFVTSVFVVECGCHETGTYRFLPTPAPWRDKSREPEFPGFGNLE